MVSWSQKLSLELQSGRFWDLATGEVQAKASYRRDPGGIQMCVPARIYVVHSPGRSIQRFYGACGVEGRKTVL